MANAAPYIASPMRRFFAGVLDALLCIVVTVFGWSLVMAGGALPAASMSNIAFLVYFIYHFFCYAMLHGQTAGLTVFDIKIVRAADGHDLLQWEAALRAGLRPVLVYGIGWAGVTLREPQFVITIAMIPLAIELGMMFTMPTRQTLSDVVSRTLVVNLPAPQPHRAPAAPMYSASDAEFGVRPQRK
jgi:uncharacterized RDD family membrane protein YckC